MPTTRSQDKPLEKSIDNPERVLCKVNMAEAPEQTGHGAVVPQPIENEEEGAPELPDMENTRVSEARKEQSSGALQRTTTWLTALASVDSTEKQHS